MAEGEAVKDDSLLFGSAVTAAAAIEGAVSVVTVSAEALAVGVDLMPPRPTLVLDALVRTLLRNWF